MIKINKKIISSGVALTLLPSVFTGCTMGHTKNHDNSVLSEDKGISYDDLKDCYYVIIENDSLQENEYYIARCNYFCEGGVGGFLYNDIKTNKEVFKRSYKNYDYFYWTPNGSDRKFINEIRLEDYLYSLGMIKFYYSNDDINNILEEMKKIDSKELVKEL